jgi:hypothetical protein
MRVSEHSSDEADHYLLSFFLLNRLTSLLFPVMIKVTQAHPPEALRERQTCREAGAQSLRASLLIEEEVAGLPNSGSAGALWERKP